MINRELEALIVPKLGKGKAIIILGPRQTGKTTLLRKIAGNTGAYKYIDCDDAVTRMQLETVNTEEIKRLIGHSGLVIIDEAQRVKNVGLVLKIICDQVRNVQLLVSGSSSLDLMSEINEPLTGRKWEYFLFPVSWTELSNNISYLTALQQLEARLLFGMYPEVINNAGSEKEVLQQLSGSMLYKDLLSFNGIRKPELLHKLLRAVALQLGNEVSYNELSRILQVDKKTIMNYLDLLEKAFIVFRLNPFSRNMRNEISTNRKIYFYDNGIRNALIANFNRLELRNDTGALWENFLISERLKRNHYTGYWANSYFWRTTSKQEIDYIEESDGSLFAYEFKWSGAKTSRLPKSFERSYPASIFNLITPKNFTGFLK